MRSVRCVRRVTGPGRETDWPTSSFIVSARSKLKRWIGGGVFDVKEGGKLRCIGLGDALACYERGIGGWYHIGSSSTGSTPKDLAQVES